MTHQSKWHEHTMRTDTVYWGNPQQTSDGGITFATPVQIKARWSSPQALNFTLGRETVSSKARLVVEEPLALGGFVYNGTLASLSTEQKADPTILQGAYRVIGTDESRSVDGKRAVRTAWLG